MIILTLKQNLKKNSPLYFSKKNSRWYYIWKDISKDYGGYIEYKISFPRTLYTTSFNPRIKNKIVKITKENIQEYKYLKKKYKGHINFIKEMNKRNIIGIDATSKFIIKYVALLRSPPEGFIWKFPKTIKIKKYEICNNFA